MIIQVKLSYLLFLRIFVIIKTVSTMPLEANEKYQMQYVQPLKTRGGFFIPQKIFISRTGNKKEHFYLNY